MNRQQETTILRLWRDWCRLWPEQYGHNSLQVQTGGYDPVFDVIPCQTYKDFYLEVVRHHPKLRQLNPFEVIDTALNQIRAPETTLILDADENDDLDVAETASADVYSVDLDVMRQGRPGNAQRHNKSHPPEQKRERSSATVTELASARKAKSA